MAAAVPSGAQAAPTKTTALSGVKFAGYVGNEHVQVRKTPFFDTRAEVVGEFDFIAPCANWREHQRWNRDRVGNYAQCPVVETMDGDTPPDAPATKGDNATNELIWRAAQKHELLFKEPGTQTFDEALFATVRDMLATNDTGSRARYSVLQAASGAYTLALIGSHREAAREQSGFKPAFTGTQLECWAHIEANRQQFPVNMLNAEVL
jgi:hypothetical protein